jgi:uroporphyrinogen-III synthase
MSEEWRYDFYFKFGTMGDSPYHNPAGGEIITLISASTPEEFAKHLKDIGEIYSKRVLAIGAKDLEELWEKLAHPENTP